MTVAIVGGGPAALILSFILKGHRPVYDSHTYGPHPDLRLHELLLRSTDLLEACNDPEVLNHVAQNFESFFGADVLPVNILIDALAIPTEVSIMNASTMENRIKWTFIEGDAIDHTILGDSEPGGQWSDFSVDCPNSRVLSYAEMLALPGLSFSQFYTNTRGQEVPDFYRPTRSEVAEYYKAVQKYSNLPFLQRTVVKVIRNKGTGRWLVHTKEAEPEAYDNIVLASGVSTATTESTSDITLDESNSDSLVIGSGVSAADAVLLTKGHVTHIYKWLDESGRPTPLRRYPRKLYPEYCEVFDRMTSRTGPRYTGLPNGQMVQVSKDRRSVIVKDAEGNARPLSVGSIRIRTGRSGSLEYASDILGQRGIGSFDPKNVSKTSLRQAGFRVPHITPDAWVVGSLTGDSLIRFLSGCCYQAAGQILSRQGPDQALPK